MALITQNSRYTLAEATKAAGYDAGSLGELQKAHGILDELPFFPNTHGLKNRQVQAVALPNMSAGMINGAIASGQGRAEPIEEPTKLYELESIVDTRLLQGVDNPTEVRDSQDEMVMEGCLQGAESKIIFGNDLTTPDDIRGLAARRPSLGTYCLGMGGSGSTLSSAYLVMPGKKGLYLGYPGGTRPGISSQDMGKQRVTAASGSGQHWAWIRLYQFFASMILRDPRALIRLANIDSSHAITADKILEARGLTPLMGSGCVLFVNRDVQVQIDKAAYNKTNLEFSLGEVEGYGVITRVGGMPVRMSDALTASESTVS